MEFGVIVLVSYFSDYITWPGCPTQTTLQAKHGSIYNPNDRSLQSYFYCGWKINMNSAKEFALASLCMRTQVLSFLNE